MTQQAKIAVDRANLLLDVTKEMLGCKNDRALSSALEFAPPVISKMRHGVLEPGATFLIRAHERAGITFSEIRRILDVPPEHKF